MTLIIDGSRDIGESLYADRGETFVMEIQEGAGIVSVSEPVFGGMLVNSDQSTINLEDNIHGQDNKVAIRIDGGSRITVDGTVHGDITLNHPEAEITVRGNIHGDIKVNQGLEVRCRQSIHGDVAVEDPTTRVRLGKIYDNLYAVNSNNVSRKKVYGQENITEKEQTRKKTDRTDSMTDDTKSKPSSSVYDEDLSSIESDKLAVWITASIANIQSTVEDVWLTDRSYQNVSLTEVLREIDTVKKAKKLERYNSTVNFTDKQMTKMENVNETTGDQSKTTIQDVVEYLADESYDELHNAVVEFEQRQDISQKKQEDTEKKSDESVSAFEDV